MRMKPETVSAYRFQVKDLKVNNRRLGISAFMRIRNGADWLELSIRSHMAYFDEIVAVYNQCTDATPDILMQLQQEFGEEKLRVIHYLDEVHPPGSVGHAATEPSSPNSLVNYYNFSLASTRFRYATKLDDDHLAINDTTREITDLLRSGEAARDTMYCFSGLNLFRRSDGELGILASDPVSGGGDIGFFRVTPCTHFTHDRRFERFQRGNVRRQFSGFLYWHLKFLKRDMGFGNYELEKNPQSRYAKRQAALSSSDIQTLQPPELASYRSNGILQKLTAFVSEKHRLLAARNQAMAAAFPDKNVYEAILRTVDKPFRSDLVLPDQIKEFAA